MQGARARPRDHQTVLQGQRAARSRVPICTREQRRSARGRSIRGHAGARASQTVPRARASARQGALPPIPRRALAACADPRHALYVARAPSRPPNSASGTTRGTLAGSYLHSRTTTVGSRTFNPWARRRALQPNSTPGSRERTAEARCRQFPAARSPHAPIPDMHYTSRARPRDHQTVLQGQRAARSRVPVALTEQRRSARNPWARRRARQPNSTPGSRERAAGALPPIPRRALAACADPRHALYVARAPSRPPNSASGTTRGTLAGSYLHSRTTTVGSRTFNPWARRRARQPNSTPGSRERAARAAANSPPRARHMRRSPTCIIRRARASRPPNSASGTTRGTLAGSCCTREQRQLGSRTFNPWARRRAPAKQ